MGYLNGNTITVDAILTKRGRQKLAEGSSLGITKFALSDDGVDYTLFNPDHTLGSSFYGEAITDLPQLEAVPDDGNLMKYTLMTMDRNTLFLPKITSINSTYTLENQNSMQTITPNTENGTDSSYQFLFNDETGLRITGGTKKNISGATRTFLNRTDIPSAAIYTGPNLKIQAAPTDVTIKRVIQIIGAQSGAVTYVDVEIFPNIRKTPTVTP